MKKKIKWIIVAIVLLVLVAASVATWFLFFKNKGTTETYENEQQQIMHQWHDFDCNMSAIVSNYDFTGSMEDNLEEWEAFSEELEDYMDKQIEEGVLDYYTEGLCCYLIGFENGFEFILEAPFELEGIMAGGSGISFDEESESEDSLLLAKNAQDEESASGSDDTVMQGRILTMEPVSNQKEATNTIVESAKQATYSDHEYKVISYKENDCNDFFKLMDIMKSWGQYDMVVLEAHGMSVEIPDFTGTRDHYDGGRGYYHFIQIADSVDYLDLILYKETNFFPRNGYYITIKPYSGGNWREATAEEVDNEILTKRDLEQLRDTTVKDKPSLNIIDYNLLLAEEKITGEKKYLIPEHVGLYVRDEWLTQFYRQYPFERKPIIYLANCFAGQGDEVGQALLDVGARAVVCYYNETEGSYHADMFREIMRCMTTYSTYNEDKPEYYTLEYGIESAKQLYGETCTRNTRVSQWVADQIFQNKEKYDFDYEQCYIRLFTNEDHIRLPLYNVVEDEYYSGGIPGEYTSYPTETPETEPVEEEIPDVGITGEIPEEYREFCEEVIALLENGDLAGFKKMVYPLYGINPILDITVDIKGEYCGFHLPDGRVLLLSDMGDRQLCLLGNYSDGYLTGPWMGFSYIYSSDGEYYGAEERFAYAYIDETALLAHGENCILVDRRTSEKRTWESDADDFDYTVTVYDEDGNIDEDESKTSNRGILSRIDWINMNVYNYFRYNQVDYFGYGDSLADRITWAN